MRVCSYVCEFVCVCRSDCFYFCPFFHSCWLICFKIWESRVVGQYVGSRAFSEVSRRSFRFGLRVRVNEVSLF